VAVLLEKEELLADEVRDFFDQFGLYTPDPALIENGEEVLLPRLQPTPTLPEPQSGD
jgi:hypothetical protein